MKLAVLVPTRSRPGKLTRMLESMAATRDPEMDMTVWLGIDADDPKRDELLAIAARYPFVSVHTFPAWGKFPGVGKLWNTLAMHVYHMTAAELFMMAGDDMIFKTPKWNRRILDTFARPDRLEFVYCNEGHNQGLIAVNPTIHRRYIDLTGYYVREEFRIDAIDYWLQLVFAALGRDIYLADVLIEHDHPAFGAIADPVFIEMHALSPDNNWKAQFTALSAIREQEISMLAEAIHGKRKAPGNPYEFLNTFPGMIGERHKLFVAPEKDVKPEAPKRVAPPPAQTKMPEGLLPGTAWRPAFSADARPVVRQDKVTGSVEQAMAAALTPLEPSGCPIAGKALGSPRKAPDAEQVAAAFETIYATNGWNNAESVSGDGSTKAETETLRKELPALWERLKVRDILDAPCGDFNWMAEIIGNRQYTGMDIVKPLVEKLQHKHGSATKVFRVGDIGLTPLPYTDFVICRDCLVHLPLALGRRAIANMLASGCRWLALTTFPDQAVNADISVGGWRKLNMELEPYFLGKPDFLIRENHPTENKCLAVWDADKLRARQPRKAHFIWVNMPGTEAPPKGPMDVYKYIGIRSFMTHNPEFEVNLWTNKPFTGSLFEELVGLGLKVRAVHDVPPFTPKHICHYADWLKCEILFEHGGVYQDIEDTVTLGGFGALYGQALLPLSCKVPADLRYDGNWFKSGWILAPYPKDPLFKHALDTAAAEKPGARDWVEGILSLRRDLYVGVDRNIANPFNLPDIVRLDESGAQLEVADNCKQIHFFSVSGSALSKPKHISLTPAGCRPNLYTQAVERALGAAELTRLRKG